MPVGNRPAHAEPTTAEAAPVEPVIRLLLADDQTLVRSALAALLELEDDFEVVAQVGRGDEVVAAACATRPDVALLDIEMPGMDGLAAAAALAHELPACRLIMLTVLRPARLPAPGDGGGRVRLRRQGRAGRAAGRAVRRVAQRRARRRPRAGGGDAGRRARRRSPGANATCWWPPATAPPSPTSSGKLFLSEGTVRNYLSAAIAKTGVRNRVEAVRAADERGWL